MSTLVMDGVRRRPVGAQMVGSLPEVTPTIAMPAVPAAQAPAASQQPRRLGKALAIAAVTLILPALGFVGYQVMAQPQAVEISTPATAEAVAIKSEAKLPTPDTSLGDLVSKFAAGMTVPTGIYVKDLTTGQEFGINQVQLFKSASFYKLFVAKEIFKLADTGQIKLSDRAGVGDLTIAQCLRIMINASNNDCGVALGEKLGWGKRTAALREQGYVGTDMARPQKTTVADVALLFERLYSQTLLAPTSTDQFLQFLREQRVVNRLPLGLPTGTEIAHKTGDLEGLMHDGGIIYGPKTNYLVVMMSGPWSKPSESGPKFADLSKQLYTYFNQ